MKRTLRILTVAILCVSMFAGYASALTFDVLDNEEIFSQETIDREKIDSWAKGEVMAAREAGLIPALTDNPAYKGNITREQFAELVVQTVEVITGEEAEAAATDTFPDTTNESVLKANKMGIINGRDTGIFDPKATATRQEIATMISRAIDYIETQTGRNLAPLTGGVDGFADNARIMSYAKEHVGRLAANGVMNGSDDGGVLNANPRNNCTVQESILLLYRVYGNSIAE